MSSQNKVFSFSGRVVLRQNQKYYKLLSSQRSCSDQVAQTLGANMKESYTSQETSIDSEMLGTTKQSTGVDPLQYDEEWCYGIDEFYEKNDSTYLRENYFNQFPSHVVIDRIVKLALIIERHLDQDKEKLVNIGRFSNVEEKIKDIRTVDDVSMDLLFTISSELGIVTMMDWYHGHEFMIAVSYDSEMKDEKGRSLSVICIWNLNNTQNPERIYMFPSYVINMEFSKREPHLLLIVCRNGEIHVLEVSRRTRVSINVNDSNTSSHIVASNHSGDREIRTRYASWHNQDDQASSESFLCSKDNGEIRKYTVKTPLLESKLLMKWSPNVKDPKLPNLIAEDVRHNMNDVFYVTTGEGKLHKISQSREEIQHTYNAHEAMITSFDFSSFLDQLLLTSSADGIIKIWWENTKDPLISFEGDSIPITKARWHPKLSTVIISIVQKEIQLWEIAQDKSKPYLIQTLPSNEVITDFMFSKTGVNLALGDDKGNIFVFKILSKSNISTTHQVLLLCKAVLSWQPPRPLSGYLKNVYFPNISVSDNLYERANNKEMDSQQPSKTHLNPCKTLMEKFEELLALRKKGEKTEKTLKKKKKKYSRATLKRLCCGTQYKEDVRKHDSHSPDLLRKH